MSLSVDTLMWRNVFFPSDLAFSRIPGKRSASEMVMALEEEKRDCNAITFVDLSRNSLFVTDLKHVLALVEKLPNCEVIDLSNNRLRVPPLTDQLVAGLLIRLLHRPSVKFVDISLNAIASLDGIPMFEVLSCYPDLLKKLVWVPESHLSLGLKGGWRNAIPGMHRERAFVSEPRGRRYG